MASLMNGLSSLGAGVSAFAATAGLEQQKSDLAKQTAILADQLATTRGTTLQAQAGDIAATAAEKQQTFTSGENTANRVAEMARTQATINAPTEAMKNEAGGVAATQAARATAAKMAELQETARLNAAAPTPEMKMLDAVLGPGWRQAPAGTIASPSATSTQAVTGAASPSDTTGSVSGAASATPAPAAGATPTPATAAAAGGGPLDNPLVRSAMGLPKSGSDEDVRSMLMRGVNTDPKFKNAPESERASEFLNRYNISKQTPTNLSSATQDMIADRVIAGDKSAMAELGFGNSGASNRAAVEERITNKLNDAGLGGADLAAAVARYAGETAGARVAGSREANVSQAVFEAKLMMPIALKASEALDRTQFPTLNSLLQSVEKATGGDKATMLAGATNSFLNAYARAVTPLGQPTEGAQNRAREVLAASWTKGQYSSQMGLLMQEMNAAQQSPVLTQATQAARISGRPTPDAATNAGTVTNAAPTNGQPPATAPADNSNLPPLPPGFRVIQ